MRPEIEAYLREHGPKYTTDALRRELITAGHDPDEVDAALRETKATRSGTDKTPSSSGISDAAWALYLIGAVLGALGALLAVALAGMVNSATYAVLFLAIYAITYLGLGYLLVRLVRWVASEFEIHGVGAVLLGLVLMPVFGALMFGTCVAASNLATPGGG